MTAKNTVRFLKYCVKKGNLSARVHYSAQVGDGERWKTMVTVYAKDYSSDLAEIFAGDYTNNTDTMTDYFDKGSVQILENHPLYPEALKRAQANEASR